jgi:hypothetical protein
MANILINRGFYKFGFALTKISGRFWYTGVQKCQSELILLVSIYNVVLRGNLRESQLQEERD